MTIQPQASSMWVTETPNDCCVGSADHPQPNYGFPCVTGYHWPLARATTNCWFCGRDLRDEVTILPAELHQCSRS